MHLTVLDVCVVDYFQGTSMTYINVPIHKEITKKEIKQLVIDEYDALYEHLVDVNHSTPWPLLSDNQLGLLVDNFITSHQPFKHEPHIPTEKELESAGEFAEAVYMFIGITS